MFKKLWIIACLMLAASVAYAGPDAGYQKFDLVVPIGDPQAGREAFIAAQLYLLSRCTGR